jgi:hypothetical protein
LKRWTKDAKKGMMAYEQGSHSSMNNKEAEIVWRTSMIRLAKTSRGEDNLKHICQMMLLELDEKIERELARLKLDKYANAEEVEPVPCDGK